MPTLAFCISLIAILLAPGPTNTLLALSGAESGAWRALRLLPLVALAYALTVVPLAGLGEGLLHRQHWLRAGMSLAAAAWVAWMAYALWRRAPDTGRAATGPSGSRVFVTTLLNPKALIIGLVLVPAQAELVPALALFFVVLTISSAGWVLLGAALHARAVTGLPVLRRVCAGWLGLLAVLLGWAALSS